MPCQLLWLLLHGAPGLLGMARRARHGHPDRGFIHAQPIGELTGIFAPQNAVANRGHHRGSGPKPCRTSLGGVQRQVLESGCDREFEERAPPGNDLPHALIPIGHSHLAGIHSLLGNGHEGLRSERLIFLKRTQSRLLARSITIEREDDFATVGPARGQHETRRRVCAIS